MSSRFCMSPSCWRQSKLWFHQFRQFAVVNAHYLSIDYLGLLGKRLQYGQSKVCLEKKNILVHSSEKRGLRSTKCSSKMLQILLYFMYKKTHISSFFRFSFHATLYFYLMNALVYANIKQGIHKIKMKCKQKICGAFWERSKI